MSRRQIIKDTSQERAATNALNDAVYAHFTPLFGGRKTAFPDLLAGAPLPASLRSPAPLLLRQRRCRRKRMNAKPAVLLEPVPETFNLARYCLAENARLRPQETAITVVGDHGAQRWTHGEFDLNVRRLAAGLRSLGLPAGARVMIRMGNEANAALAYFAAIAAGYVALLASSQLTFEEADFLARDCGAAILALGAAFEDEPHKIGRAHV